MSLAALMLAASFALAPSNEFVGAAEVNGQLQYRELHTLSECEPVCREQQVQYLNASGQPFASKTLEFVNPLPWQPNYQFSDTRFDIEERVWLDGQQVRIERHQGNETNQGSLTRTDSLVIDAGFHPFVQHHLAQLANGQTVDFDFLSSVQLDSIAFRLRSLGQDGDTLRVALQLQNRLLRAFVSDIVLQYDLRDGRLLSYDGLTNIRRHQGRGNYNALIRYSY